MKHHFHNAILATLGTCLAAAAPALAGGVIGHGPESAIDGAGRNIMRTAEGGIVAAFSGTQDDALQLVFSRSADNGKTWDNVRIGDVKGAVTQVAVDSNFNGSYIAFTEQQDRGTAGRIAYFAAPFASDAKYVVSQSVTPPGVAPRDTFIQASRAGWGNKAADNRETVVYGWQDATSKSLYIGVSPDGRNFPVARLVVNDPHATSGPAVAIRGNYVVASYQTTNPDMAPADVPADKIVGRSFPAWIESNDGGATWSAPAPLFGRKAADFPSAQVELSKGAHQTVRLAGGTSLPNSPILNWTRSNAAFGMPDKTVASAETSSDTPPLQVAETIDRLGATTFVQTSMMAIGMDGQPGEVSIVSFRPVEPDAKWTHVVASNALTTQAENIDTTTSKINSIMTQFQYSALIDTPVRATVYKEVDAEASSARLVAAVSTDTGKNFKHHVSFSEAQLQKLGIDDFTKATVFAASQCLFEDRDGEVYVDLMVANGDAMQYARLPIGVNAVELRSVN